MEILKKVAQLSEGKIKNMEILKKVTQLSKGKIKIQNQFRKRQYTDTIMKTVGTKMVGARQDVFDQVDTARLWLEEFTGLDKVHAAQSDVSRYQNEFIKSQNKRRELGNSLSQLQAQLNDLHNEIVTTNRSEGKYLELITAEHKLLKLEKEMRSDFARVEAEERENFTLFTTKIKESQDIERQQALRTKYWMIIVSTVVTVIGVLGNSIISYYKIGQYTQCIDSKLSVLMDNYTDSIDNKLSDLMDKYTDNIDSKLSDLKLQIVQNNRTPSGEKQSSWNLFGLGYVTSGAKLVGSGLYNACAWTGKGVKYVFVGDTQK